MRHLLIAVLVLSACAPQAPVRYGGRRAAVAVESNVPHLSAYPPPAIGGEGSRNLFAFVAAPVVSVRPATTIPTRRIEVKSPALENPQPHVVEPPFPYRYIGRFGPESAPFAVFEREGELISARVGESVGDFRLQRIGIESVDVLPKASSSVQRIPL